MAVQWSAPELAERYSSHVEELRDFFALQQLHFGAAEDIAALMGRIEQSESFREDMTSMVRSIILHEGGVIPRANLLEIVAIAIGGRDMDEAGAEVQEPLHQLLAFLMSVQRKPWNEPPGESRLRADRAEFVPISRAVADGSVGAKVIPITARVAAGPVAEAAEAGAQPFARRDRMFSRLTGFESEGATALGLPLEPDALDEEQLEAGAPSPVPEPQPVPPPPPVPPRAIPPAAEVAQTAALDPEPPIASYDVAMHLPIALPEFRGPRMALPASLRAQSRIAVFFVGGAVLCIAILIASSRTRAPAAEQVAQPQAAGTAPSGQGVTSAATAVSSASDQSGVGVGSGVGAASDQAQPAAVAPAKPSAYGPEIAQPQGRVARQRAADDYVAKPYSTATPSQAPAAAPIVRAAPVAPAQTATATPAGGQQAGSQLSAGQPTLVATAEEVTPRASVRPANPDATYVGASEESIPMPRRPASIASAVMAANLVSAPQPSYPMLAKVAHVQGTVVLRAEVDRDGNVMDVSVLSGHRLLRGAAVDAVRRWRYRPYVVDGHPATVSTTITLNIPSHR